MAGWSAERYLGVSGHSKSSPFGSVRRAATGGRVRRFSSGAARQEDCFNGGIELQLTRKILDPAHWAESSPPPPAHWAEPSPVGIQPTPVYMHFAVQPTPFSPPGLNKGGLNRVVCSRSLVQFSLGTGPR